VPTAEQHPHRWRDHQDETKQNYGHGRVRAEQLHRGSEQDERERPSDQRPGQPRRQLGADPGAGDRADEQGQREIHLEVAEDDVTHRCGSDEWHRLHEVGAHEFAGPQRRIERHQGDDDQRAGTDGRDTDDQAADRPDEHGRQWADPDSRWPQRVGRATSIPPLRALGHAQVGPDEQADRGDDQRDAERLLDHVLDIRPMAERTRHQHAGECGRHRADAQPANQVQAHGPVPKVYERAHGLHDRAGHQVAGNGRQRWDAEQQHEHRRHQGAAAHSGEPDDDADAQGRSCQSPIHAVTAFWPDRCGLAV
jgi:hypothetical protein